MIVLLLYQEQVLPVAVRVSPRSRSLRVSCRIGGNLVLSVPPNTPQDSVLRFLDRNRNRIGQWVLEARQKAESLPRIDDFSFRWRGQDFPVLQKEAARSSARFTGDAVHLGLRKGDWPHLALERLRLRLSTPILREMAEKRAAETGLGPISVSVRAMLSRFGSCNPKTRHICLNSYLTRMPDPVIQSVIDHELCHLTHAGHDTAFYQELYRLNPDYTLCKQQLKKDLSPYLTALRLQRQDHRPHPAINSFNSPIV